MRTKKKRLYIGLVHKLKKIDKRVVMIVQIILKGLQIEIVYFPQNTKVVKKFNVSGASKVGNSKKWDTARQLKYEINKLCFT